MSRALAEGRGGGQTLTDHLLDEAERAISEEVREMACRLNRGSTSFGMTAENLARAAHLMASKETLSGLDWPPPWRAAHGVGGMHPMAEPDPWCGT